MPTPQLASLNPNASLDELKDYLVGLNRYLNYLLSSLDTLNISRLDAKVIIADTITADKLNVSELSAISANLGKVIAGILVGAYIATADGTYPRTEMDVSGDLLAAYASSDHYIKIDPGLFDDPILSFVNPSISSSILNNFLLGWRMWINTDANMLLQSGGTMEARSSGGTVNDIPSAINNAQSDANSAQSDANSALSILSGGLTTTLIFDGAPMGLGNVTLEFDNGILVSVT